MQRRQLLNLASAFTIFDIDGMALATFDQNHPFRIKNRIFEAHLQSDGFLRLCTYTTVDTRHKVRERYIKKIKNELVDLKKELVMIEKDITMIRSRLQKATKNTEELELELTRMRTLKKQHRKRISNLQNQTITYQKICKVHFCVLRQGVFRKLQWFPKPVMWCIEMYDKVEEKILTVTEKLSMQNSNVRTNAKGHFYPIGINTQKSYMPLVELYNLSENKWRAVGAITSELSDSYSEIRGVEKFGYICMPDQRRDCGIGMLGNHLYVIGGYPNRFGYRVEQFDPKTKNNTPWLRKTDIKIGRSQLGVAELDGQLYAIGGLLDSTNLSSVERYNPYKNTWATVAPMHYKRSQFGVVPIGGRLYAVGGYGSKDGDDSAVTSYLSSVECYNPYRNEWTILAPMNSKRSELSLAVVRDRLYAIGGRDQNSSLSSVEYYDIKQNKWTTTEGMSSAEHYQGVAVIADKLYTVGGHDSTCLWSIEWYDQDQNKWTPV